MIKSVTNDLLAGTQVRHPDKSWKATPNKWETDLIRAIFPCTYLLPMGNETN